MTTRKTFVTRVLVQPEGVYRKVLTPREQWISAKAAALLHRVRVQRDAAHAYSAELRKIWREERAETKRLRAELAQADAARVNALEVAEAARKAEKAAMDHAGALMELITELMRTAPAPQIEFSAYADIHARARRLLRVRAEHKAQERAS